MGLSPDIIDVFEKHFGQYTSVYYGFFSSSKRLEDMATIRQLLNSANYLHEIEQKLQDIIWEKIQPGCYGRSKLRDLMAQAMAEALAIEAKELKRENENLRSLNENNVSFSNFGSPLATPKTPKSPFKRSHSESSIRVIPPGSKRTPGTAKKNVTFNEQKPQASPFSLDVPKTPK